MSLTKIVLCLYGLILLVGGYFGYVKAGSKISLIMGIISGVLIFLGLFLTNTSSPSIGYVVLALTSSCLVGIFFMRLLKTHQFMPSGMLLLASAVALIISIVSFLKE